MNMYETAKLAIRQKRSKINSKIKGAMNVVPSRTAGLIFDLSSSGTHGITNNVRAHQKAIELVGNLLDSFNLPVRPSINYLGIIKNATDRNGVIEDGVIRLNAVARTFLGHKVAFDIPVIVHDKMLLEPAVFFFDNAPYVMCAPAFEQIIRRGTLDAEQKARLIFQPPVGDVEAEHNLPRRPIINQEHMFSPGPRNPFTFKRHYSKEKNSHRGESRQRTNIDIPTEFPDLWKCDILDHMLDPAERNRDNVLCAGCKATLAQDITVKNRGGGALTIPSGEEGVVVRDMEGDGLMLYVNFPTMQLTAVVPHHMFKKKKRAATLNQVQHEIKEMRRDGYGDIDIKEVISRRYPEHAMEVLEGLDV